MQGSCSRPSTKTRKPATYNKHTTNISALGPQDKRYCNFSAHRCEQRGCKNALGIYLLQRSIRMSWNSCKFSAIGICLPAAKWRDVSTAACNAASATKRQSTVQKPSAPGSSVRMRQEADASVAQQRKSTAEWLRHLGSRNKFVDAQSTWARHDRGSTHVGDPRNAALCDDVRCACTSYCMDSPGTEPEFCLYGYRPPASANEPNDLFW